MPTADRRLQVRQYRRAADAVTKAEGDVALWLITRFPGLIERAGVEAQRTNSEIWKQSRMRRSARSQSVGVIWPDRMVGRDVIVPPWLVCAETLNVVVRKFGLARPRLSTTRWRSRCCPRPCP
jgi:hypothetical protein